MNLPVVTQRRSASGRVTRRAPDLIAAAATVLGVLCLVDSFWGRARLRLDWFSPVLPVPARLAAQAVVTVSGLLLLRVATGLRRGKRTEWRIAVGICVVMTVAHLVRGPRHPVETGLTLTLLLALLAVRSRFTAQSDPHGPRVAVRLGVQSLLLAVGYGLVALYLPGHVPAGVAFSARLREVALSLVGAGGWIPIRGEWYADAYHLTMLGFGLVIIASTFILMVRTAEPAPRLSDEDERRLRELLRHEGWRDSLGYFAVRRDKSVVWSSSGKAAIAYRVVWGVALASGDPVGNPEAWPGAIGAYRRLVEAHGWVPAILACGEQAASIYRREYGLTALALGEEAIVTVADFSLDGRAVRGVRQACARLGREGYRCRVRRSGDLTGDEVAELRAAANRWRGNDVERGYSMALSRLGDPSDRDAVIVTAHQDGRLHGVLQFVPWGADGLSLDLMRRDRAAANGVNELMIVAALQASPDLSVRQVSLNFAMFRDPLERGARIGAGPLLRARRAMLLLASRWWQIDSLYRFNAKFQPDWLPRFLVYPTARDLPRIAVAALEAEAFLARPQRWRRLLGRG